jgi:hypothetical protein
VEKKKDHNQPSSSSTPMEKAFAWMGYKMQNPSMKSKKVGFNS